MINCPKCHTPNPDGAKFCKACRSPIPKTTEKIRCPNGHIMDPTWKICPVCQAGAGDGGKKNISHQKTLAQVENAMPQVSGSARRKTKVEGHILDRGPVASKKAKGSRKNNFTFLMDKSSSSNLALECIVLKRSVSFAGPISSCL